MKKNLLLFFCVSTLSVFYSCSNKSGETGLLIPQDAGFVVHIDLSSLSSKLSWKEIQQTAWYANAQKEIKDSFVLKQLLNDPANSGVNTESSLAMFLKRNGNSGYFAIEGLLKNVEQFKKTILDIGKNEVQIQQDGSYSFVTKNDRSDAVLYFNDKMFVFVADASDAKNSLPSLGSYGSTENYSLDSLKYFAKNTFELKGKKLLDSDERFANLIADKADIHYWINAGNLYGGMMNGALSMMKISDMLDGNISTAKLNFENGKIVMSGKQFYGKELAALFKKYSGKNVSNELLSKLPDQNVLAAFVLNYNPEGIKEFLKIIGVDGMVNAGMAQFNYSIDDFIKANAGELLFSLIDFSIKKTPTSLTLDDGKVIQYDEEKSDAKFIFGTSVKDKTSFQKLIDAIDQNLNKVPANTDEIKNRFKNKLQDKWFALGSSDAEVDAFLNGNKKPSYADIFSGHNGGGYLNLQKIITTAAANNDNMAAKKMFDISAAFWKNITMLLDMKDGTATSTFEINLQDANTNALKQLSKYVDEMYLEVSKNKDKEMVIQ
jgi:hypothetical protein